MFKVTPNPPEADALPESDSDSISPYSAPNSKKLHEAAERALDHYLKPHAPPPRTPSTMFVVAPNMDTESLLAHACESMASASIMLSDFAALAQLDELEIDAVLPALRRVTRRFPSLQKTVADTLAEMAHAA